MEKVKERDVLLLENLTFARYINFMLADSNVSITNLVEDLRNGTVLILLVEKLSRISIGKYQENPKNEAQRLENYSTLFKFIQNSFAINISEAGINIFNITRGIDSLTMLNELLWRIIYQLQVIPTLNRYNIETSSLDYNERLTDFLDIKKHKFMKSFNNGDVFIKILHRFYPEFVPDENVSSSLGSIYRILSKFGVPQLIKADEIEVYQIPEKSAVLFICIVIESFFITRENGKIYKKVLTYYNGTWAFDGHSYYADDVPLIDISLQKQSVVSENISNNNISNNNSIHDDNDKDPHAEKEITKRDDVILRTDHLNNNDENSNNVNSQNVEITMGNNVVGLENGNHSPNIITKTDSSQFNESVAKKIYNSIKLENSQKLELDSSTEFAIQSISDFNSEDNDKRYEDGETESPFTSESETYSSTSDTNSFGKQRGAIISKIFTETDFGSMNHQKAPSNAGINFGEFENEMKPLYDDSQSQIQPPLSPTVVDSEQSDSNNEHPPEMKVKKRRDSIFSIVGIFNESPVVDAKPKLEKKKTQNDGKRKIFKLGSRASSVSKNSPIIPPLFPGDFKLRDDRKKGSIPRSPRRKSTSRELLSLENSKMQTMLEDLIETNYQLEKEKKELQNQIIEHRKASAMRDTLVKDLALQDKDKKILDLDAQLTDYKQKNDELLKLVNKLQNDITKLSKPPQKTAEIPVMSDILKKRRSRGHNTVYNVAPNSKSSFNHFERESSSENEEAKETKGFVRINLENNTFVSIHVDDTTTSLDLKEVLVKKALKVVTDKAQRDLLQEQYDKYVLIEETILDPDEKILPIAKSHTETSRFLFKDPNAIAGKSNSSEKLLPAETDNFIRSNDTIVTILTNRIQSLEQEAEGLRTQLEKQKLKSKGKRKLAIDISKFQINEKLAEVGGSFAQVYSTTVDGWVCAMKELNIQECSDYEGFEREVALFEILPAHPNIVRYLYHEKVYPHLRLFMQKYGGTLGDYLKKKKAQLIKNGENTVNCISLPELQRYLLDISNGICFLHTHGVMHRDLKSDNIFYTVNANREIHRLAVGDFDTAKVMRGAAFCKTIVGTPSFIAPEVLKAKEGLGYNFKADVYSFGMIIYELLSLSAPYEGCSILEVSSKILNGERPVLPDNLSDTYSPFVELFTKCTSLQPEDRPDSNGVFEYLSKLPFIGVSAYLYS